MTDADDDMLPSLSFVFVKDYPKAWQEFWDPIYSLSKKFGVDVTSALEIFRLVYECVSKEEERRPVSTGFFIGDRDALIRRLPDPVGIKIERKRIVETAKTIRSLFGLVDGYRSAFIIGKEGMLEDARLMPKAIKVPDENSFTPNELYCYCDVLKEDQGYGLISLGSLKSAKLFSNGSLHSEIYFSGKEGEWTYRSLSKSLEKLEQISREKGIDPKILNKIFSVAIRMSNYRKGGSMILGDSEKVLRQSEDPRFKLSGINILNLKGRQEKHLFNLATQEFALVISREGETMASSVRLKAKLPKNAVVELTALDGGRHRSAAEISASTDSVAVVVSDDGPITIYSDGKRLLRV